MIIKIKIIKIGRHHGHNGIRIMGGGEWYSMTIIMIIIIKIIKIIIIMYIKVIIYIYIYNLYFKQLTYVHWISIEFVKNILKIYISYNTFVGIMYRNVENIK